MWKNLLSMGMSFVGGSSVQIYIYLAIVFGGFSAGFYVEHLRFSAYETRVEAAGAAAQAKTESIQKQQELVNKGIQNEFEGKLAAVKSFYSRMQFNPGSSSMPGISATPKGTDAETAYPILAGQCAETTLQVNLWQQWAIENGSIK